MNRKHLFLSVFSFLFAFSACVQKSSVNPETPIHSLANAKSSYQGGNPSTLTACSKPINLSVINNYTPTYYQNITLKWKLDDNISNATNTFTISIVDAGNAANVLYVAAHLTLTCNALGQYSANATIPQGKIGLLTVTHECSGGVLTPSDIFNIGGSGGSTAVIISDNLDSPIWITAINRMNLALNSTVSTCGTNNIAVGRIDIPAGTNLTTGVYFNVGAANVTDLQASHQYWVAYAPLATYQGSVCTNITAGWKVFRIEYDPTNINTVGLAPDDIRNQLLITNTQIPTTSLSKSYKVRIYRTYPGSCPFSTCPIIGSMSSN